MNRLAIVVPAWKAQFLAQALESIAAQGDGAFDTWVFDDAGPSEVAAIAARFPRFRYHRFERNLGGRALVQHWNRCLEHVPARWVWLFADDDVMAPGSVDAVLAAIERQPALAVLQLPVQMVSEDLRTVLWSSQPPAWESAADFLRARLRGERLSCLPDHVFDAHRLRAFGGFVDLPLAWNTDDATWLLLGRDAGIGSAPGALVQWRQSESNISARQDNLWVKLQADLAFMAFLDQHRLSHAVGRAMVDNWFERRLVDLYRLGPSELTRLWNVLPWENRRTWFWLALRLLARGSKKLVAARPLRRSGSTG